MIEKTCAVVGIPALVHPGGAREGAVGRIRIARGGGIPGKLLAHTIHCALVVGALRRVAIPAEASNVLDTSTDLALPTEAPITIAASHLCCIGTTESDVVRQVIGDTDTGDAGIGECALCRGGIAAGLSVVLGAVQAETRGIAAHVWFADGVKLAFGTTQSILGFGHLSGAGRR